MIETHKDAAGVDLPFDATADDAARAEQLLAWEQWYVEARPDLAYDATRRRLVAR